MQRDLNYLVIYDRLIKQRCEANWVAGPAATRLGFDSLVVTLLGRLSKMRVQFGPENVNVFINSHFYKQSL